MSEKIKGVEEAPQCEVDVWIESRDKRDYPATLVALGFKMKAYASDFIHVKLVHNIPKGGVWITLDDLKDFAKEILELVEGDLSSLRMCRSNRIAVLVWKEENGDC